MGRPSERMRELIERMEKSDRRFREETDRLIVETRSTLHQLDKLISTD